MAKSSNKNRLNRALGESDRKRVNRGEDMYGYGEQKKKFNISITKTAIANITELAKDLNLSRSEVVEQLFRTHYKKVISLFK